MRTPRSRHFTLTTSTPVTLNAVASNIDSRLTGTLAAGDYLVVIDNLSETANDLTFQLAITSP